MFGKTPKKSRQNPIDSLLSRELSALEIRLRPWKKDDGQLKGNPIEVTADNSMKIDMKNFQAIKDEAIGRFAESLDEIVMLPIWVELYNFYKEIQLLRNKRDYIENDVVAHLIKTHPEVLRNEKSTVLKLQKLLTQEVADKGIEMTSVVTKMPNNNNQP